MQKRNRLFYTVLNITIAVSLLPLTVLGQGNTGMSINKGNARPSSEAYTWKSVEIVGGGFIPGIIFSPVQKDLVYARTDIGGVYRWNPATKRWIPLTDWVGWDDWNLLGGESIAADPVDANRVYVAAGEYTNFWSPINCAILRSTNQGNTFERIDMPFKLGGNEDGRSIGERLAIDLNKNSILYLGTRNDGLWKSTDYASTWEQVTNFPVSNQIGFILFDTRSSKKGTPSSIIYVGTGDSKTSLYYSKDEGKTWEAVPGQPTQNIIPHHGILDMRGNLYLTYSNGLGPNNVSNGAVWKYNTNTGVWTDITPEKPGGFGYAGLAIDNAHPSTIMVSTLDRWSVGDTLFRTTDAGSTWVDIGPETIRDSSISPYLNWGEKSAKLGHWIGDLEIDPFNSNHALYVTGATMWGTDNLTEVDSNKVSSWTVRAEGIEETAVEDLISPPQGAHLLSGLGDICGFRHDDLTKSPSQGMMQNPIFGGTVSLDFAEQKPMIMARVGRGWRYYGAYSIDGGSTWSPFATGPGNNSQAGKVAVSADGKIMIWTPENGTAYSTGDFGKTWTICSRIPGGVFVTSDRVNPNKFYGYDNKTGTIYVSSDGGKSFVAKATNLPNHDGRITAVPDKEGDLWLTNGNGGIYHSTNSGESFSKVSNVEEGYTLGFGKAKSGFNYMTIYLVGEVNDVRGVFRSDDVGTTWIRINDDQHQYGWIGRIITGDPRIYGRVYLGSNGLGIHYGDPVLSTK